MNSLAYAGEVLAEGGGGDDGDIPDNSGQMSSDAMNGDTSNAEVAPEEISNTGNQDSPSSGTAPLAERQGELYTRESEDYKITIGTVQVSDIQVRNAISKAVRDAIYGKMGLMTTLNNGKPLKIKTGF